MVTVQLLKSYCLPVLLYGLEAVGLSATNMHILDMYRIFGIGDHDNVWQLRQFLGLCSIGKRYVLHMSPQYGALRPTNG